MSGRICKARRRPKSTQVRIVFGQGVPDSGLMAVSAICQGMWEEYEHKILGIETLIRFANQFNLITGKTTSPFRLKADQENMCLVLYRIEEE